MRFSARSFTEAASAAASSASSCGLLPRGRVPLIGRASTIPRVTETKRSGEPLRTLPDGVRSHAPCGTGDTRRSSR
nr:hypothetical protein [Serinicoccus sp. CUA-874]